MAALKEGLVLTGLHPRALVRWFEGDQIFSKCLSIVYEIYQEGRSSGQHSRSRSRTLWSNDIAPLLDLDNCQSAPLPYALISSLTYLSYNFKPDGTEYEIMQKVGSWSYMLLTLAWSQVLLGVTCEHKARNSPWIAGRARTHSNP